MKRIIKLNDKQLTEAIKSVVKDYIAESRRYMLNEANNNMKQKEFEKDLKDLGFEIKKLNSGFAARMTYGGKTYADTIHPKHDNRINGEVVNRIFNALVELGYFKNADNIRNFPFVKWGLQSAEKDFKEVLGQRENENHEIEKANELYADAEVYPALPEIKSSVYVIQTVDGKCNLCRSQKDRRPLYDEWFDRCEYDRLTHSKRCLKRDNYDTFETEAYPINADGTFGEVIIENKLLKNKNFLF